MRRIAGHPAQRREQPEQKAREQARIYSVAVQEAASRIERLLGWPAAA